MEIKIRKAVKKDLDKILELNQKLFDYEKQFDDTFNPEWTYSEVGKNSFIKCIKTETVLIAEVEDRVVGYVCATVDNYSFRGINPIAELENMYVEEEFRNKGVGSKLVEVLLSELKDQRVKRIKVGALHSNTEAIKFYKKNGFENHVVELERDIV